ncbi:MAG: type II toxin-antitoxin system Phd/YefM family antitoxin [Bacteroidetes bacterium]|nr:type II toxin-antitoxin system Phd/YefM family antitoxin [Bacteroidota bacterium]
MSENWGRARTQWWLSGFSYEPAFSGWPNYFSDGDVLFVDSSQTMIIDAMIEITSTEFRKNMGKYLTLATEKKEPVLVRYRDKGVFALTLTEKKEKSSRSKKKEMRDTYFEQPEVLKSIRQGKADIEAGRCITINDPDKIWESILS